MDNIAYLNHIASKPKMKKPFFKKRTSKISVIIIASLIVSISIIIPVIGGISSSLAARETDFTPRLVRRIRKLDELLNTYHKTLNSSNLRAESAQLLNTTTSMLKDLPSYIEDNSKDYSTIIAEEDAKYYSAVTAIEDGRVSGHLDRTFARYITYYTSITISLSNYIIKRTPNDLLKAYLEERIIELSKKQDYFSSFNDNIK